MDPYLINPIDLMPFIGVPQNQDGQKKKLIKLYQAEAQELLDKGDVDAYNLTMEKIKNLQEENNSNN
jgi:hypothetical protein